MDALKATDVIEDDLAVYEPVYAFVKSVPPGKVVTYAQVADFLFGVRLTARQVGTAMRYSPPDVPWQRVVGAGGKLPISKRSPQAALRQRALLEAEGVCFHGNNTNRIDMAQSQWHARWVPVAPDEDEDEDPDEDVPES